MSTHWRIIYHALSSKPPGQPCFFFKKETRQFSIPVQSIFTVAFTPERGTLTVLMLQYEGTAHRFMHSKGSVYLFKIHIHWAHNQRAVQWDGEASYRCISLEARNSPIWYKEISYANLVGDSIVSYGPQRMQEQCLPSCFELTWIEWTQISMHFISLSWPSARFQVSVTNEHLSRLKPKWITFGFWN